MLVWLSFVVRLVAAAAPVAAAPGQEHSRGNASRVHSRVDYPLVVDNMKIFSRFLKIFS